MKNVQLDHTSHHAGHRKLPICFLAHNIELPINVGSLFRIADAFGIEMLYLTGTSAMPPNSKLRKTSRATENNVPFQHEKNPLEVVERLKAEGYKIISLEITSSSIDISDLSLSAADKVCLILGSENTGVNQELLNASDITTHIPMLGQNSSLNVATASAIAGFEIMKRYLPE